MKFSVKQAEVLLKSNSRWNIYSGATRSGKTFLTYFIIVKRLQELGHNGRKVMIGKTISTLSYNVLEPMRDLFGEEYVSQMKIDATGLRKVSIFGYELRCVGANDKRSMAKIQGSGLIYAYGDEVATWDQGIFDMLKSRLDSKEAKFDGTTNPDAPNHWLKKFHDDSIIKGLDVNWVNFVIDDNTYLDPEFIENLKKEYLGTVYYDRFILGRWVAAEGSIYNTFIAHKDEFIIDKLPEKANGFISVGIDFGGNKSGQAFSATFISSRFDELITVKDYWNDETMDPNKLESEFCKFLDAVAKEFPRHRIVSARADSAEQVLKNGLQAAALKKGWGINIGNSIKSEINERIRFYVKMFGLRRYKILKQCSHTISAFEGAVWEDNKGMKDVRLDDGTSNIDTLDAQEYSTEEWHKQIEQIVDYTR